MEKIIKKFMAEKKPDDKLLDEVKKVFKVCSDIYYNSGDDSPLTDEEFDMAVKKYRKYRDYIDGAAPKSNKRTVDVSHEFPELVGTLDKVNTISELYEWFEKLGIPAREKIKVLVSEKKDGNSVTLTFNEKDKLKLALTRGEDGKGADLTRYFKNRKSKLFDSDLLQKKMGNIGIKYEAIVNDEIFNTLCEKMGRTFANPRSIVSGILSAEDGEKYSDYIMLTPLRVQFSKRKITREKELSFIKLLNESTPVKYQYEIVEGTISSIVVKIEKIYQDYIDKKRSALDHPIDGLVIEILNEDIRERLGRKDTKNRFEVALKFPYLIKRSKVQNIEFYYGLSGRITPVVVFDKVIFNGAECTHASIANYKRFKELSLAIGDDIFVEYRNDTLSYITKDPNNTNSNRKIVRFPKTCSQCKEKLFVNKKRTFVHCRNKKCPGLIKGRIVNYLEKLGIKGVKESTISKLVEHKLLKKIEDLYTLDYKKVEEIPGLGSKSAENIKKAIEGKTPYDYEIIGGLGIKGFGRRKAKIICTRLTLKEIIDSCDDYDKLYNIILSFEGFSHIMADITAKGLKRNKKTIIAISQLTQYKSFSEIAKSAKKSYNFVFTGFRNPALQKEIEDAGHSVKSSVSGKTHYLVASNPDDSSTKLDKARELGIPIIKVGDIKNILNI
jgi:DNA ligase (NAD+)